MATTMLPKRTTPFSCCTLWQAAMRNTSISSRGALLAFDEVLEAKHYIVQTLSREGRAACRESCRMDQARTPCMVPQVLKQIFAGQGDNKALYRLSTLGSNRAPEELAVAVGEEPLSEGNTHTLSKLV